MIALMDDLHRRKQEVCDRIRRKIGGAGLSLAEVDRRAGWSAGYLSQVLNGHNSFRLEHLIQLTDVLEISLSELLGGASPEAPVSATDRTESPVPGKPLRYQDVVDLLNRRVQEAVAAEIRRSGMRGPEREPD